MHHGQKNSNKAGTGGETVFKAFAELEFLKQALINLSLQITHRACPWPLWAQVRHMISWARFLISTSLIFARALKSEPKLVQALVKSIHEKILKKNSSKLGFLIFSELFQIEFSSESCFAFLPTPPFFSLIKFFVCFCFSILSALWLFTTYSFSAK